MSTRRTTTTTEGIVLSHHSDGPADPARVAALEASLGVPLPDDYRQFLLAHNGGRPKPAKFVFARRTGPYTDSLVDWFLALYDGEHSNLETVRGWLRGRIPPGLLPIAIDPFGNFVLLGLAGAAGGAAGKVYFWDHEEEPAQQPDWSNIDLVADSFDAFLAGLTPSG